MKNNAVNWGGYLTLMACFAVTIVFFLYTIALQPGPVDANVGAPAGLTYDEYIQRKKSWIVSTDEAIARGQESYNINCAFCHAGSDGKNEILSRFQSGDLKHGKTELEVFAVVSKGINGTGMKRMDHLLENERWDIVHYLRSLNKDLPATRDSKWKVYFSEQGI